MSSAGPTYPGTVAEVSPTGLSWTNLNNVKAHDVNYATVAKSTSGTASTKIVKGNNFGFSIPTGATINGIEVKIYRKASANTSTNYVKTTELLISPDDGATGSDLSDIATKWATTDELITAGGPTELWDLTWTPSQINGTGFSVFMTVTLTRGTTGTVTAYWESVSITVYYTEVDGTSNFFTFLMPG